MSFFNNIKNTFSRQGILAQLIIINVAVFLTINIVGNLSHLHLTSVLALPLNAGDFLFRFWTLFTYMFTHENLGHIFWNMFLLYFSSQIFFTILGQKKMQYVYIMSGLSGGALVLMLGLVFSSAFSNAILLGASAAVMGVAAVMAVYTPNYTVYLWGIIEMRYKYFFLLVFGVSTVIDLSVNTGGKISHIGGALFGLLYGYQLKRGIDLSDLAFFKKKKSRLKVVSYQPDFKKPSATQNEELLMNALLDKISKSGYDSLTKTEKDTLFKLSQKK
jgi:membrane associated rhomboid family serine protease